MRQEERDTYLIPPNFIEGGTLMGGMFKTRNAIEAGILGALTASRCLIWESPSLCASSFSA